MARIGGAFPLPFPLPQYANGVVQLGSGQVFYPPSGNYIFSSGLVTCLQWFDPQAQNWRILGQTDQAATFISVDGVNYRLINLSGVITGASITNVGSGAVNGIGAAVTGVGIAFAAPAAGGAPATATGYPIVGGSVQAPTVSQAGSLFLVPPLVVIDPPPPGGIQATAVATLTAGGGIASIVMQTVGAGYIAAPNFYLIPQPGSYQGGPQGGVAAGLLPAPGLVHPNNAIPGNQNLSTSAGALLTPNILTGSGTLTGIGMINNGLGYDGTHIPAITITGCGLAAATAIGSFSLTSVTLGSGGAGFGASTPPLWISSLGMVAPTFNNNELGARVARGVCTLGGGAVASFVIEDPGYGLQKVPSIAVIDTSALHTGVATGTAVIGGIQDISFLQQAVQ